MNILLERICGLFSPLVAVALNMNKGFTTLFFKRETKELLGRNYINLWILLGILFLTFTAIGFSNGSLNYLKMKMEDPFIQFVNIPISQKNVDSVKIVQDTLSTLQNRRYFNYSQVNGYYKFDLYFQNMGNGGIYKRMGRTIEDTNPLINAIFDKSNLIKGRSFSNARDLGVIVTQAFVESLKAEDASHILMYYPKSNDLSRCVSLPILAVVKELPDLCGFAVTPYFYYLKNVDEEGKFPFSPVHTKEFACFVAGDLKNATSFCVELNKFVERNYKGMGGMVSTPRLDSSSYIPGYEVSVSFVPAPDSISFIDSLYQGLRSSAEFAPYNYVLVYNYPKEYADYNSDRFDFLSINFVTLDKIRLFKDTLFLRYGINIDMAQVEAKENYFFVTNLTRLISIILIIFSVLSITFFLTNVLKNHLEKIKMNIGTFKAFGFDDTSLRKIYLSILGLFVGTTMLISLMLSWIFGSLGGIRAILWILQINLQKDENYFELLSSWTLISIFVIILISFIALNKITHKIFAQNPGDLIYDRGRE